MAIRSFQFDFTNASGFTLIKTLDHLCGGIWTHQPPDSIPSGATVSWKSESGGNIPIIGNIATGTEGIVKYRIGGNGDSVFIHWDNPFLGTTTGDGKVVAEDIQVDIDNCKSVDSGGGAFVPPPSKFELILTFEGGMGGRT